LRSDVFQRHWGLRLKDDSKSKKKWATLEGGGIYATSAGGAVTGFGAGATVPDFDPDGRPLFGGAVIIDDPLKPEDAFSEPIRSRVNRRFHSTILSRLNSRDTPIVLIMQRLHEQDMSGYLLAQEGEHWRHLNLPALNEDSEEPLWPYRHTADELRQIEQGDPYAFAAQYQQHPAPLGGSVFKDAWWQFYDHPPANLMWRAIYADTAQKTGEANDYSVFQCWDVCADGKAWLLDLCRGKWEAPELEVQARAFWNKHKAIDPKHPVPLRKFAVEDKVSGTGLLQKLGREGLPIEGIQRSRDKLTRAMDVTGYVAAGHVFLPSNAPWLSDYLVELGQFPQGRNDDQVDPTLDALNDMLGGQGSLYDVL
jgi:predicted phage terminase large subunit-like protein